jgi:hypothetical protein
LELNKEAVASLEFLPRQKMRANSWRGRAFPLLQAVGLLEEYRT